MKMENDIFGKLWIKSREKRKKEARKKGGWREGEEKRKRGKKERDSTCRFRTYDLAVNSRTLCQLS